MHIFDIFEELCEKAGVTTSKAASDMVIDKGTVSKWKAKRDKDEEVRITPINAKKFADYFHVSIDSLYGNAEKAPAPEREDLTDLQLEAIALIKQIKNEQVLEILIESLRKAAGKTV